MILTKSVKIKVNGNNINHLIKLGYSNLNFGEEVEIFTEHLSKGSHVKIRVKCDICGKERDNLMYKEYIRNLKSGGYYSCSGKCSSNKNRATNLKKYGVDYYSKTTESKQKIKETCLSKYGVENYSQTTECLEKIKRTMIRKYEVENASNLEYFKEKRKNTMNERYGVDYYVLHPEFKDKSEKTCIHNIGVKHPMMIIEEVRRRLQKRGLDFETNDYKIYRRKVDYYTKKNKKIIIDNWNGHDYYDGEYIRENFNLQGQNGDYPTIDHMKSVKDCFIEGLLPIFAADINNLCITKRRLNSKKNSKSYLIGQCVAL